MIEEFFCFLQNLHKVRLKLKTRNQLMNMSRLVRDPTKHNYYFPRVQTHPPLRAGKNIVVSTKCVRKKPNLVSIAGNLVVGRLIA